jgi:hypothetical protein
MAGRLGEDLDDQVRCALDVPLFEDRGSLPGDEEEVGLDNVVGREDDIRRGDEESHGPPIGPASPTLPGVEYRLDRTYHRPAVSLQAAAGIVLGRIWSA